MPYDRSRVSYDILAYLFRHPHARDTLEGIVEWWLLEQAIMYHTALVKEALTDLVSRGLIIETRQRDGAVGYGIAGNKKEEVKKIIRQGDLDGKL